jgi:hypothetical protein
MSNPKRWPIIRRKKPDAKAVSRIPVKASAKSEPTPVLPPAPKVTQPEGAYARFWFEVTYVKKDKSLDKIPIMAYTQATAEKQAQSLCAILRNTHESVKKVVKKSRVCWPDSCVKYPWFAQYQKEWKKYGKDNLKE